jgi:hypothetical protein
VDKLKDSEKRESLFGSYIKGLRVEGKVSKYIHSIYKVKLAVVVPPEMKDTLENI